MSNCTDIVIIGAGVAGLAAAIAARQAGFSTIVVERCATPPTRPGETLHPGAGPIFAELGLLVAVERLSLVRPIGIELVGHTTEKTAFGGPPGEAWRGYQLCREELSRAMVARARALDAEFRFGQKALQLAESNEHVTLETAEGEVKSGWCFDATGSTHWSHRKLGGQMRAISPQMTLRYRYDKQGSVATDWPRLRLYPTGWQWEAVLRPHRFARVELTHGRAPHTGEVGWRHADGTWRLSDSPARRRVFRLGDAGGRIDPSAGKGVLRAMMSALLAVHLVKAVAVGRATANDATRHYARWFRRWIEGDAAELAELIAHRTSSSRGKGRQIYPGG